jgi:hypothetical protein
VSLREFSIGSEEKLERKERKEEAQRELEQVSIK